jgi:PBP1b-binding outer membrane lipoprotein LpoB
MKKATLYLILFSMLAISGCSDLSEQAEKTKKEAEKLYGETTTTLENTKNQVLDTKQQIEKKVGQAQDAAEAIQKLVE